MPANFIEVTSSEQLDALFRESHDHPVALVKHSNTCGISVNVMYDLKEITGDVNVIVVQTHRDLSDETAERLNHRHQSPQAFVIKDGKAIYHATHYGIDPTKIESKLRN
ncbi:MAG: bacillithiol system redox-active protein YtxJ [Pyrinomonadaceae bacterium]